MWGNQANTRFTTESRSWSYTISANSNSKCHAEVVRREPLMYLPLERSPLPKSALSYHSPSEQDIYLDKDFSMQRSKLFCCTDTNNRFNASSSIAAAVLLINAEQFVSSFCMSVLGKESWDAHTLMTRRTHLSGASAFLAWTSFRAVGWHNWLPSSSSQPLELLSLPPAYSCCLYCGGYRMQQ